MKISARRRWKQNQLKIHHYFVSKKTGRFKNKRDRRGKYVILLNKRKAKYGAILKFIKRRLCRVEQSILIDRKLIKQFSSKFIITPKRHKRLLNKVEVIFTKKNIEDFKAVASLSEVKESKKEKEKTKKITPIKIFSCKTCNHKFTRRKHYEEHIQTHVVPDLPSSDSEGEMVIDDDCILVLDESADTYVKVPRPSLNLKEDPDEAKPDEFYCMVDDCGKKFDREELLVMHIATIHDRHEDRPFKCKKCGEGFKRESGLMAHDRIAHTVEVIDPSEIEPPKRSRRQSVFISNPPKSNGLVSEPNRSDKAMINNQQTVVSFKPFDSTKKTSFSCHICSSSFQQRSHLDRHVLTQHIIKSFVCYKCNVGYQRLNLIQHLKSIHLSSINETEFIECLKDVEFSAVFRCCFCRFSVKNRHRLIDHLNNEHYEEFEKHGSTEGNTSSSPDSLENLFLPGPAKLIENELDLLVELKTNQSDKKRKKNNDPSFKFQCDHCGIRYSRPCKLKTHYCRATNRRRSESKSPQRSQSKSPPTSQSSSTSSSSPNIVKTIPIPQSKAKELAASIFAPTVKKRVSATSSIISQMRNNSKSKKGTGFFGCQLCSAVFTDKEMFSDHTLTAHASNKSKSSTSNGF